MDKVCPTCGSFPMGTGCYHICPNSIHYYSPEQERADDPHYGEDDMRERYAATAEPSQYADDSYDVINHGDTDDGPDYGYGEARAIAESENTDDVPF